MHEELERDVRGPRSRARRAGLAQSPPPALTPWIAIRCGSAPSSGVFFAVQTGGVDVPERSRVRGLGREPVVNEHDHDTMISRRRFTQAFASTVAATVAGRLFIEQAPPPRAVPPTNDLRAGSGKNTSLGPTKQDQASVLNVGYPEFGPATGPPVVLLHGWPYDPHSYVDVGPLLETAGYRVIIRICAGAVRQPFCPRTRSGTHSNPRWLSTS